ncbi:hypothetical protein D9C73_010118 [Collichthys lucidus]|uniref:Uncharacterized protein n=1 Tax=Collichthys lucidus TaxID=240159 RepID=A0A4U5UMX3_COLLU|nr:hypothetical protein D9C73_010118 [Collichthys lucidus]
MNDLSSQSKNRALQLLKLVERYDLHHVKTLPYNNVQGVLEWLGANPSKHYSGHERDTVTVLNTFIRDHGLETVQVMGIDETPELEGKERLVVYIKKHRDKSHTRDSIVLFLVMRCPARAPYMRERSKLIENAKFIETRSMPLFPSFATCPDPDFKPVAQQTHPVIDSFLPKAYETTASNAPAMTTSATGEPHKHGSRSTVVLEHGHGERHIQLVLCDVGATRRLIVERDNVFELNYMTAIGARELHVKHRDRRPSAEEISTKLQAMGRHIKDRYFVSMGMLCITLYPQERWSPSKLLSLPRYQRLSEDVDEAQCSPAQRLPLSVRVGEYRATDIIACEDSVPEELTKLTMDGATAGSPITVIETQQKEYYGIDLLRLAPGRIEPYDWYSKKVKALEKSYAHFMGKDRKRKADGYMYDPIEYRQPKSTPAVDDPGEGTSAKSAKQRVSSPARHLPPLRCDTTTHVRRVPDEELLAVRSSGDHVECDNASRGLQKIHGTQLKVGADVLIQEASQRQDRSTSADQVCKTVYKPRGTMILRSKSIKGELDTKIVILKGCDANEITHFKQNYGQLLEDCKPVAIWNESDSPNSVYSFLLQVLLTLKTASDAMLLPTHMCEWTDILISKGAVMTDTVSYLSKNYMKPQSSLFSDKCESLISLCTTLVAKHLPESELCQWLIKLNQSTVAYQVLTGSIQWLRNFDCSERRIPCLMSLDDNVVTFRDYSANLSNWLTNSGEERGEEAHKRSSSNTLVYGHPKPFRGNQTTESALDTKPRHAGISSIDQLNPSSSSGFAHDAVSKTESKWAPVIMFGKHKKQGPVQELTVESYTVTILVVHLSPNGSVKTLTELFQGVAMFSESDY